ncbi:MAG: radical SAM family heme chaperone HemW [Oscillospiraceae bacterium]|nr:radical SAM family heme chaperone HemW [Oscillospiraceae bacterium]
MNKPGVYIHIPFCKKKCSYCDFYSMPEPDTDIIRDYCNSVVGEIDYEGKKHDGKIIYDTLYIGGGDPASIGNRLVRIIEAASIKFNLGKNAEITVESNPESMTFELSRELKKAGVNRISFGAQSADDNELAALGRTHSARDVQEAVYTAKSAGIRNISIDLILGIPYQTTKSLDCTLNFAKKLNIPHISAYILKLEKETALYANGIAKHCPDENAVSDIYLYTVNKLEEFGYAQYEISNFSKCSNTGQNFRSLHNLKYWRLSPYTGIGSAAHSFDGKARYSHSRNIKSYIKDPVKDKKCYDKNAGGLDEYILLSLRLADGLDCAKVQKIYGTDKRQLLSNAEDIIKSDHNGLLRINGDKIQLTPRGFLLSNMIINKMLECVKV